MYVKPVRAFDPAGYGDHAMSPFAGHLFFAISLIVVAFDTVTGRSGRPDPTPDALAATRVEPGFPPLGGMPRGSQPHPIVDHGVTGTAAPR